MSSTAHVAPPFLCLLHYSRQATAYQHSSSLIHPFLAATREPVFPPSRARKQADSRFVGRSAP